MMAIRFLDEQPAAVKATGGRIRFLDEKPEGFLDKVGKKLDTRLTESAEALTESAQGRQTIPEGALQIIGKGVAGSVVDVAGEGLAAAGRGVAAVTPQPIKDAVSAGVENLSDTEIVQMGLKAAKSGVESYNEFAMRYPRAARNIESVVNIGLVFGPPKAKPAKAEPGIIGKAGEKLTESGVKKATQQKVKFVEELITPRQVKKVREAQVKRTVLDKFGTKQIQASMDDLAIADDVAKIPGVSPSKTLQGNYNAIADANVNEAKNLVAALEKNPIPFSRKESFAQLRQASQSLSQNPLISGNAENAAQKVMTKMQMLLKENPSTAAGVLKARKQLDAWIKQQGKGKVFTSDVDDAVSIAVREIRGATNDFIAKKATNVGVKESLKKQSNLFSAMDRIAPKAADEAATVLGRVAQRVVNKVPLHTQLGQIAGLTGGAVSAAALASVSPFFTTAFLGGLALGKTGQLVMSPTSRKMAGALLKAVDKSIKLAATAQEKAALRLDRAAVVGVLKQYNVEPEEVRQDAKELGQ